MVDGSVFIGAIIIAVTQVFKLAVPRINGAVTIGVAILVGILVALLDKEIGIVDITVAQGILIALGAAGVHSVASRIGETSN